MNAESLLKLARAVYPDNQWWIPKGKDMPFNEFSKPFHPSLDGTERQNVQALDCIVAAMNIGKRVELISGIYGKDKRECSVIVTTDHFIPPYTTGFQPDILTAATAALLQREGE